MERRLLGSRTKEEVDELMKRLDAAEATAAEKHNDYASLSYRADVGWMSRHHRARNCMFNVTG